MKKEKNIVSNEHTFLELPVEKYDFYDDPEVISYIDSLEDSEKLSKEELTVLLEKKDLDKTTKEKLFKAYMHLPIIIAKKYSSITNLSNMDLISEGNMGLLNAIESYTIENGDFYQYLVRNIKKSILNACLTSAKYMKLSKDKYDTMVSLNKIEEDHIKEYQREKIYDEEIYDTWNDGGGLEYFYNLSSPKVEKFDSCNNLRYEITSLDTDDKERLLGEDSSIDLDRLIELDAIKKIITDGLEEADLTNVEKYVLMSLFGFIKDKSSKELAIELNVNIKVIYMIERHALSKIKKQTFYKLAGFRDKVSIY